MSNMTIGEYLRLTDIDTYRKLLKMFMVKIDKSKKEIRLGDSVENLMRHDSYKKIGGKIKQTRWE